MNILTKHKLAPMPTENSMDIPPKTAGKKVIEEGVIELNVENNTPELLAQLNAQYKQPKKESTNNKGR